MEKIDALRAFVVAAQASKWAAGNTTQFTSEELIQVKDFAATLAKNAKSALEALGYVSPMAAARRRTIAAASAAHRAAAAGFTPTAAAAAAIYRRTEQGLEQVYAEQDREDAVQEYEACFQE